MNQTDVTPETDAPEDLESLRARAAERDQYLDLLKRTQADFENYQKRNQREREQERKFAHKALAHDLLPILDNFDRALEAASKAGESGPTIEGVRMVQAQLLEVLKRHGIEPIEARGKPFDPNLHQAVLEQPTAEHPPGTVVDVLARGFTMYDRVLRPSSVVVSRSVVDSSPLAPNPPD
jgi:molecular chaperone GrpE